MRCKERSGEDGCRLSFSDRSCEGEDNCNFYRLAAEKLCPSCNNKGADWTGWGKHGGFNYTCWSCEYTWTEPLVWPETPGICKRCGREFDNPVPEVTRPDGNYEIASEEWCADCNTLVMSVVYRESSAYRRLPLYDPIKGGIRSASS